MVLGLSEDEAKALVPFHMNNATRMWKPEERSGIYKMFKEGASYSTICEKYQMTKGQLAGMLRRQRERMGQVAMPKRVRVKKEKPKAEPVYRPTSNYTFNPGVFLKNRAPPTSKRVRLKLIQDPRYVTLLELEPHHCRWPIGDPKQSDFRFCGCDRVAGRPYCDAHSILANRSFDRRVNEGTT